MKSSLALCVAALLVSACASVPAPTDLLASADLAVQRANASRGDDPSSAELKAARAKLAAARDATARGDMLFATRLAREAQLDADLSTARSEASKAQFDVEAMKKTNEALRQQALRNAVNVAPIAIPGPIEVPIEMPSADPSLTGTP